MATKSNHKYRVSVYLGKDLYEELTKIANIMGISLSTTCRIVLNTGYELSKSLDAKMKGGAKDGENK